MTIKNTILQESGRQIFKNGTFIPGVQGITNVIFDSGLNCLSVIAGSGTYQFSWFLMENYGV